MGGDLTFDVELAVALDFQGEGFEVQIATHARPAAALVQPRCLRFFFRSTQLQGGVVCVVSAKYKK